MFRYALRATMGRMDQIEFPVCAIFNRFCQREILCPLFVWISRMGNGVFWYFFMVFLPVCYGRDSLNVEAQMLFAGLINIVFYTCVKSQTLRLRPYQANTALMWPVPPLDNYSFPSGHTLHAVAFTFILVSHSPVLGWVTIPFTILVGLSRVVLGLHYPSDVLAGGFLGFLVAKITVLII
jgi:undecaprenyl-diphosphatase